MELCCCFFVSKICWIRQTNTAIVTMLHPFFVVVVVVVVIVLKCKDASNAWYDGKSVFLVILSYFFSSLEPSYSVLYAFFIKPKSYYGIIIIVITIIIIMLAMVYTDNSRIERHWNGKWKYIMWELTWITCVLFSCSISIALYRCFYVFALPFEWHFIW